MAPDRKGGVGLVRIGNTIRRPLHDRSAYVQAVLVHLEAVGFDGAPRFLGLDAEGREILTYIEGEVLDGSPTQIGTQRLRSAARLIRDFHEATAGTTIAHGGEVVCHGDLGHHNIVFRGERAVGLIDWDRDVAPGRRLVDLAHAVWCLAAVGEHTLPISHQAHAIKTICAVYGWSDSIALVDEIADRLRRARNDHAVHHRAGAAKVFEEMIASMEIIEPELRRRLQ